MKLINAVCCGVALFSLSAWAQSTPAVPEVMKELRKIESAQYRGEVDLLRIGYQDAAKAQPTDVMSRVYVAWCSMVSDDAWNQLKNIATMNPENPWVHYGMGRVYVSWKMRDPARGEFELVLKKDPGFAPALTGLGDLARQAKDWSTAERKYHEALALQDDPLAHSGLGLTLLALGKTAEAQKELARAIALWPDQPATLSALVPLLVAAKDPGALDAAARVAELRPRDRDVRRQLADLRFETGDLKGAVADYEKLLTLGTPDVAVVKRVLDQYRTSGDAPNEARLQAMLATLDRDDPAPVLRLAELKLAANDAEGAQAQLLAALATRNGRRPTTCWRSCASRRTLRTRRSSATGRPRSSKATASKKRKPKWPVSRTTSSCRRRCRTARSTPSIRRSRRRSTVSSPTRSE